MLDAGIRSNKELAELIGTNESNISRWLNGVALPGSDLYNELLRVLGKPPEYFEGDATGEVVKLNTDREIWAQMIGKRAPKEFLEAFATASKDEFKLAYTIVIAMRSQSSDLGESKSKT